MKRTCRKSFFCKLVLCAIIAMGVGLAQAKTYTTVFSQSFDDANTYTNNFYDGRVASDIAGITEDSDPGTVVAGAQFAIQSGADRLVNIGVCGGFDESMRVGDVYEVEKAVQYDFDLSEVNGTEVGVLNERVSPYFGLVTHGRFSGKILGTEDRFTNGEEDFPRVVCGRRVQQWKTKECT